MVNVNIFKLLTLFLLQLCTLYGYSQYDNVYNRIQKQSSFFRLVKGSFFDIVSSKNVDGERVNYMYTFSDKSIKMSYVLSQANSISDSCDYFLLFNKKFCPSEYIHDLPACELDINSFRLFKGVYNKHTYLLLTAINNGSGKSSTFVFCFLFDITDYNAIISYPLWSKYGGTSCFGDFNNDGKLDFLKVREKNDQLNMSIMMLDGDKFREYDDMHYIVAQKTKAGIRIIKMNWW